MVDRTLMYVFEKRPFKTLGGSRTDAMVSATHFVFELFLNAPIDDEDLFLKEFNLNLPADIKALAIEVTDKDFNIIQNPKHKEYIYLFAHGEKAHPFSAPFITTVQQHLDIDLMKEGAKLFEGEHDYRAYCKKPKEETITTRSITTCELVDNTFYTASFFPNPTYAVVFRSKGFLRNQIRLIMGQLFKLGQKEVDLKFIEASLKTGFDQHLDYVAPASGLILNKVTLT